MKSAMLRSAVPICLLAFALQARPADLEEIVSRASAALKSDWAADPDYAFIERDETTKSGRTTSKTSQVVMMEGSDYYMPVAVDDKPLTPDQREAELRKFRDELERRRTEDAASRQKRIAKYRKDRDENGSLLLDFPNAFAFQLLREETLDGRAAYVLSAAPKKRNGPLSRAAKVLSGMQGTVWVDRDQLQPMRAECTVTTPVPIYGILARVLPGTHIELRMAPVTGSIWLITDFSMNLAVSKFFFRSTEITHSTYSNYRPNDAVVGELLRETAR